MEQRWEVTHGMPQITGKAVLQAGNGVMWVGTQDGLTRFDGLEFEVFRTAEHPGLGHHHVNALAEDGKERLWIAHEAGLSVFEDGDFRLFDDGAGPTGPARDLAVTADGDGVWVAAERGLFVTRGDVLEAVEDVDGALFSVAVDGAGGLLAGGRGMLWRQEDGRWLQTVLPEDRAEHELSSLVVYRDEWLLGTSDGLYRTGSDLNEPLRWLRTLDSREIQDLLVDSRESLWISTVSGLYRQRLEDEVPLPVTTRHIGPGEWLHRFWQDEQGHFWIGTQAIGVVRLSTSPFRRFTARDGLVDSAIWSIYEDSHGTVWVGTNDHGLFREVEGGFEQVAGPDDLPHRMVMGLLVDEDDRLWVNTRGGVAWFDRSSLQRLDTPADLPERNVSGAIQDADGRIWLATFEGLFWWLDGEIGRVGERQGITQTRVRDVMEDSAGVIWVATDTGLFRGGMDGFESVRPDDDTAMPSVSSVQEIEGEIWAMMQGAWMRVTGDRVRLYPDGAGLSATVASFMTRIGDEIWATSHEGIQRIPLEQFDEYDRGERERFEPHIYGALDHPVVAQCNGGLGQAGHYQPDTGQFWCPSLEGILKLDIAAARDEPPPAPRPRLKRVRAGGQVFDLEFAREAGLSLPPTARDLEIDFAGLDYRWPEGVEYRLRLVGFDDEWADAGQRRTAFYTNLPPGSYRFEVLAGNEHGVFSGEPAVLTLQLQPMMHETLWFRSLVLALLALLLFLAWRYSVRHLRRRGRVLEEMVRDRTRQLDEMNRQLLEASLTDPLTRLHNRRFLVEQMPHETARVDRARAGGEGQVNEDITFLMVDLDHFKRINDQLGHTVGDQVLTRFAEILKQQVRDSDYVVRWGGEEFLVVARHSERGLGTACAERIMEAVRAEPFETDKGQLRVTCSIGLAVYPPLPTRLDLLNWEEVIELADGAGYRAKREGRDRWVCVALCPGADTVDFMERFRNEGLLALAESGLVRLVREKDEPGQ